MGVVKVEAINVDVTADQMVHNLANDVGSLTSAFFRNTTQRNASPGPIGNTGNAGGDDVSASPVLETTSTLRYSMTQATSKKSIGEVWRYTGAASGRDEFVTRLRGVGVILGGASQLSIPVAGIVDRNRCIPFISINTADTNQSNYHHKMVVASIDASNNLVLDRGDVDTSAVTVFYEVVEFTGSNWVVAHGRRSFANGTMNLVDDSTGLGGSAQSIGNWDNALIVESYVCGDSSNNAIEDTSFTLEPSGSATALTLGVDSTAANDCVVIAHVISNPGMNTYRAQQVKSIPNNNAYVDEPFPLGAVIPNLDESCVEWTVFSDGTGTALNRGGLGAFMFNTTTIRSWVHRTGNTGTYRYGVVDLSNIDGLAKPIIDSLSVSSIPLGSQNILINGDTFEAVQGTGKVELASSSDYAVATKVEQTIDSWSNTQIQFDLVSTGLNEGTVYVFVTGDGGGRSTGFAVTLGNPPYSDIIINQLTSPPDHYWPFDGNRTEVIAALPNVVRLGSPDFPSLPLTRGSSQCLRYDNINEAIESNDSANMNLSAETTRMLGGWIRFPVIQKAFTCIYEEGGGVNNLCFFMGMGGILIAQIGDTGDDNVHAFSDFKLQPNRVYQILLTFDYTQSPASERRLRLYIDGVLQTNSFGNPLGATNLDAHSGDINFGVPDGSLEVFGTDVIFPGPIMEYQDWASWTSLISEADIREQLFELGALPDLIISAGSAASMQTALDAIANTTRPDAAMCIQISSADEGDFTLDANNITFDDRASIHIQYIGVGTLTWINNNGSNASIVSTPYGGTVNIINPASVNLVGINSNSEVRAYVGTDPATATEVAGVENSGTSFNFTHQEGGNDGFIVIHSLGYQTVRLPITYQSVDQTIPVQQILDRQYEN
jgi:hypothetical protein